MQMTISDVNLAKDEVHVVLSPVGILDEAMASKMASLMARVIKECKEKRLVIDLSGIQCFEYLGVLALCMTISTHLKYWPKIELIGLHESVLKVFAGM